MRDMEPDLELWREYDKGLAEAKERLEELRGEYEQEEKWWNDMQQMKTAREEEDAFAAAAAAAEAMYTARQAEITTAQTAVDDAQGTVDGINTDIENETALRDGFPEDAPEYA